MAGNAPSTTNVYREATPDFDFGRGLLALQAERSGMPASEARAYAEARLAQLQGVDMDIAAQGKLDEMARDISKSLLSKVSPLN